MFEGLGLDLIRVAADAPPDWASWLIPGHRHPDAANHRRVAGLVLRRLQALGLVSPSAELPAGARAR